VETIFSVLQVIIAVILVFLVLMHSGKDSGLSGAFGVGSGTGPLGGGSLVERSAVLPQRRAVAQGSLGLIRSSRSRIASASARRSASIAW
jgi:preprotein translocase subunit SecG